MIRSTPTAPTDRIQVRPWVEGAKGRERGFTIGVKLKMSTGKLVRFWKRLWKSKDV